MTVISKTEFAARRGWSKSYVSKLASQDRLVLTAEGRVELEATEALLLESADPSKAAVAARHEDARVERDVRSQVAPAASTSASQPVDFQKARAEREYYLAQLAKSEFHKVQGELVDRQGVERAAYASGRMLRDQLLGLSAQLAPEVAAMSDHRAIEKHLTSAIRRVLEDAARLSSADLEQAMTQS